MRAAVAHLIAQGHHRIALINGPGWWWPARERLEAYVEGLRVGGLSAAPELIRSVAMHASPAAEEAGSLLDLPDPPTALIVGGNVLLLGVLRALQAHGCVVGRDLALVGADDLDLTQLYSPAITVISRDLLVRGETAVQLLTEMIKSGRGRVITLPTELIVRDSSTLWHRATADRR